MRCHGAALFALLFASCVAPRPQRGVLSFAVGSAPSAPRVDSVILVTLDGTRWQDVFGSDEVMPTLHRWMTVDGVGIGAPGHGEMWASGPNFVSLPGYTEILTGRPSACHDNECPHIRLPTVVDQVIDSSGTAAVVGSWERLERVAARDTSRVTLTVGRHSVGKTTGIDDALLAESRASDKGPGSGDYRPDAMTIRVALGVLDRQLPTFMFVGLGDPDEHAHYGNHMGYIEALRSADRFLSELEKRVTERTAIIVATDHGRSAEFRDHGGAWHESGRVWAVVRAPCLAARGLLDTGALHLANIAPTIRCLLGLPRDDSAASATPIAAVCTSPVE